MRVNSRAASRAAKVAMHSAKSAQAAAVRALGPARAASANWNMVSGAIGLVGLDYNDMSFVGTPWGAMGMTVTP